jgi:hypothetical protein
VFAESDPRPKHPTKDASPERASRAEGVFSAACPPRFPPLSTPFPISYSLTPIPCSRKPFGINTCKSATKQTTLTIFRINTYEKHRGWGATFQSRSPNSYTLFPTTYPLSFHTLPHSFVFKKNSTRLFSSDSELFRKNTRGMGGLDVPTCKPSNVQMCILHPGRYCGTFQPSNLATCKPSNVSVPRGKSSSAADWPQDSSHESPVTFFSLSTFNCQLSIGGPPIFAIGDPERLGTGDPDPVGTVNFLLFEYRIGTKHYARPAPIGPL